MEFKVGKYELPFAQVSSAQSYQDNVGASVLAVCQNKSSTQDFVFILCDQALDEAYRVDNRIFGPNPEP